jgi:uncharacterized protein YndB with AHSA1/START domain
VTPRTVTHTTFTIERRYPVAPSRVFFAFADPAIKRRWFRMPDDWVGKEHSLDFRVGGRELSRGGPEGGPVHVFDAQFSDIVEDQRIVYTYDLSLDDTLISTSVATIELRATGDATAMTFTEQAAFLDGLEEPAERQHGTNLLFDALADAFSRGDLD